MSYSITNCGELRNSVIIWMATPSVSMRWQLLMHSKKSVCKKTQTQRRTLFKQSQRIVFKQMVPELLCIFGSHCHSKMGRQITRKG